MDTQLSYIYIYSLRLPRDERTWESSLGRGVHQKSNRASYHKAQCIPSKVGLDLWLFTYYYYYYYYY